MLNKKLRKKIIEKGFENKMGHYGSTMSCLDTVKYLYDKVLTIDDVFIMSKGHGSYALHTVLEETRNIEPDWTIHLEYNPEKGVMATTGSLGLGLPMALGRAYAKKLRNKPGKIYCMIGDGELQEGVIWETINIAKRLMINNLIILVDNNKYQAIDSIDKIMNEDDESIQDKLKAFGCHVVIANGHDEEELSKLKELKSNAINAFILDTIKGKGIPFLERNPTHHVMYMHEKPEAMEEALNNLK